MTTRAATEPLRGSGGSCHALPPGRPAEPGIALVGQPNVGKSVLFSRLTGRFVQVANYPGTTVEVTRGRAPLTGDAPVVDTPGIVGFPSHSADEEVTATILLEDELRAVVLVAEARNLARALLLSAQLIELELPLVVCVNMVDEARSRGLAVDVERLAGLLGAPVVPTVATTGEGVDALAAATASVAPATAAEPAGAPLRYPDEVERGIHAIAELLPHARVSTRGLALLWLSADATAERWLESHVEPDLLHELWRRRETLAGTLGEPVSTALQRRRLNWADRITREVVADRGHAGSRTIGGLLGQAAIHPFWAWPILLAVLYGMYWFVGVFGAGILVGHIEEGLFGAIVNPWVVETANAYLPPLLADLIAGDYGLWTMGVTYALALILPIVTTFFVAFGTLEDSGYLARLTVVSNRTFTALGLNGRAVLPMVLGLGCVTMATLTTRVLATARERFLAILLLALAIPCSAQLGVVLGLLGGTSLAAATIWGAVVLGVLLLVGFLAARLVPGERSPLVIELPPLRRPRARNVIAKTVARVEWYLKEAVPLFLIGTAALFFLDLVSALPRVIEAGKPLVVGWLGLPPEASAAFLLGFLRRDFGATGLFAMESDGLLTEAQMVVAMVTITLFIPCIASVLMIARERGARTAVALTALVFPLAFFVGGVLARVLALIGWGE